MDYLFYTVYFSNDFGRIKSIVTIGNLDQVKQWAINKDKAYGTEHRIERAVWDLDNTAGIDQVINLCNNKVD
jgi:hypothetical protein